MRYRKKWKVISLSGNRINQLLLAPDKQFNIKNKKSMGL